MKKKIFLLVALMNIMLLVNGCGTDKSVEYSQKTLSKPDKIEISKDTKETSYDKESEKYAAIYDTICQNWWKMSDTEEDTIEDDSLIPVESLKKLRTTSDMR